MAAGDLITADWQIEFGGLLIGDGTPYSIAQVQGLLEIPELRTADRQRLRRHGLTPGDDFLNGRSVTLTLEVFGETQEAFVLAVHDLQTALAPTTDASPLHFQIPGVATGVKAFVSCRARRVSAPIDLDFFYRIPVWVIEFFATDPLVYSAIEYSYVSNLPSGGGGLNFNAEPDFTFGAVSVGGTILATNAGTFNSSPTFRIDGPVTDPRIENVTTGQTLAFVGTVPSGDFLMLNVETRTVLLSGTASRYSWLAVGSEWWELVPGVNEVSFRASTPTSATMTMTWRSAWV